MLVHKEWKLPVVVPRWWTCACLLRPVGQMVQEYLMVYRMYPPLPMYPYHLKLDGPLF